jgi:hypothetical protein
MELAGAFRLSGDVDAAFEYGLERLTAALALQNPSARSSPVTSRRSAYRKKSRLGAAT